MSVNGTGAGALVGTAVGVVVSGILIGTGVLAPIGIPLGAVVIGTSVGGAALAGAGIGAAIQQRNESENAQETAIALSEIEAEAKTQSKTNRAAIEELGPAATYITILLAALLGYVILRRIFKKRKP